MVTGNKRKGTQTSKITTRLQSQAAKPSSKKTSVAQTKGLKAGHSKDTAKVPGKKKPDVKSKGGGGKATAARPATKAATAKAVTTKATTPKKATVKKEKEKVALSSKSQVSEAPKPLTTPKSSSSSKSKVLRDQRESRKYENVSESHMRKTDVTVIHESMMPYRFPAYELKSHESYMSDMQLKHFRNILETWKKELMKEVDNTITEMKGAAVLADPNDRATQEEAFNLELRTRDRERKLIRKIEEALQQIDDKEYGYCESCGVEIGIRRLEARPTAALCIDCKTLDEIRERTAQ